MIGQRNHRSKHEPVAPDAALRRFVAQVSGNSLVRFEEPEDAALDLAQDSHPDVEHGGRDLVRVVKGAEYERTLWKTHFAAARRLLGNLAARIVHLVGVRQIDDVLRIMALR